MLSKESSLFVVIALHFSNSNFSLDEGYKIWELWSFFIIWLVLTAFTPLDYLIHEFDHGSTLIVYCFDPRLQEAILRFSIVGIPSLMSLFFLIVSFFNLARGRFQTGFQHSTNHPDIEKRVENTIRSGICSTKFVVFSGSPMKHRLQRLIYPLNQNKNQGVNGDIKSK